MPPQARVGGSQERGIENHTNLHSCNWNLASANLADIHLRAVANGASVFVIHEMVLQLTSGHSESGRHFRVIYPFVTQDGSNKAYYPFKVAIYILEN